MTTGLIFIYAAAACLSLSSCSEINKLSPLNQLSAKLSQPPDTSTLNLPAVNTSSQTCLLLNEGDMRPSRQMAIANVVGTEDEVRKIADSQDYFNFFEFQLWSPACASDQDTLKAAAAHEFLRDVQNFISGGDLSPDPSARADGSNHSASSLKADFNAFAASMDTMRSGQTVSMLDLIEDALTAKSEIDSGKKTIESYSLYVKEILLQEKYAVALLQARYNIQAAIAVDDLSKVSGGYFNRANTFLLSWDIQVTGLNLVQIQGDQNHLQLASDIGKFLLKIGYKPLLNSNFQKSLANMRYTVDPSRSLALVADELKLVQMLRSFAIEKDAL